MRLARAMAAAVLLSSVTACADDRDSLVVASERAVDDDERVATSLRAGQTYADVSASLLESAKRCGADRGTADARCVARASAAAFFRVLSDEVVTCDAGGRERARQAARDALDTIAVADEEKGDRAAKAPPALPRC